ENTDQRRLQRTLQERRKNEQAPDAVDDTGNAAQQLDRDPDRAAQPHRTQFGEKQRDEEAERNRNEHGNERGHNRSVNRRGRAEILGDGVPALGNQEAKAELPQRRRCTVQQRSDDAAENDEDGDRRSARQLKENSVAQAQLGKSFAARGYCGLRKISPLQRDLGHGLSPSRRHALLARP